MGAFKGKRYFKGYVLFAVSLEIRGEQTLLLRTAQPWGDVPECSQAVQKQRGIIAALPKELDKSEKAALKGLLGRQVVPQSEVRKIPESLSEARFCTSCCANDFILPGLEFDRSGRCPMCQTEKDTQDLKSVLPLVDESPRSSRSRFDVALFYTGGKDSTYLLYWLSKVKGLRVLALTWQIPFLSESAKASIEGAKKRLNGWSLFPVLSAVPI